MYSLEEGIWQPHCHHPWPPFPVSTILWAPSQFRVVAGVTLSLSCRLAETVGKAEKLEGVLRRASLLCILHLTHVGELSHTTVPCSKEAWEIDLFQVT